MTDRPTAEELESMRPGTVIADPLGWHLIRRRRPPGDIEDANWMTEGGDAKSSAKLGGRCRVVAVPMYHLVDDLRAAREQLAQANLDLGPEQEVTVEQARALNEAYRSLDAAIAAIVEAAA